MEPNPWDYDPEGRLILRPSKNPNPWHTTAMADAAKAAAGFRCQLCGDGSQGVVAHHRDYDTFGRETLFDLVVLCPRHHDAYHSERNAWKRKRRVELEGARKHSVDPGQSDRFRPNSRRDLNTASTQ